MCIFLVMNTRTISEPRYVCEAKVDNKQPEKHGILIHCGELPTLVMFKYQVGMGQKNNNLALCNPWTYTVYLIKALKLSLKESQQCLPLL